MTQNSISSLQDRLCGGGWEVERARLNAKLEQKERELRTTHDQRDVLEHHHDMAKKEVNYILSNFPSNTFHFSIFINLIRTIR